MPRSNKGKKQEEAAVTTNTANTAADRAARDKSLTGYNSSVDALAANPGYDPSYLAAARTRDAGLIGGAFSDASDQLERNAASTGHAADDAGLYPQQEELAREKARESTTADQNYLMQDAQARLDTRRAIPGMKLAPAGIYQGSASNLAGVNGSMIGSRMSADNAPTFLQSAALAGISAAGQAASGNLGCWIAEAIYGVDHPSTLLLRMYLNTEFNRSLFGRLVMALYMKFGQRIAAKVSRSAALKFAIKPLFDRALLSAREWEKSRKCLAEVSNGFFGSAAEYMPRS